MSSREGVESFLSARVGFYFFSKHKGDGVIVFFRVADQIFLTTPPSSIIN